MSLAKSFVAILLCYAMALPGFAQTPEDRKTQKPEAMGVATGAPHAPVKDAMSRPITAGGFVDAGIWACLVPSGADCDDCA